jgi:hypothetical protein
MFRNISILSLVLLICSCVPSKQFVNLDESNRLTFLNKKIKNKKVKINPVKGNSIESTHVKLSSDSLFYTKSQQKKSIEISKIRSIVVSPKISFSTIAALSLFGLGTYSILSADNSEELTEAMGKIYNGIGLIVLGAGVIIFGNNIESETYYFKKTE